MNGFASNFGPAWYSWTCLEIIGIQWCGATRCCSWPWNTSAPVVYRSRSLCRGLERNSLFHFKIIFSHLQSETPTIMLSWFMWDVSCSFWSGAERGRYGQDLPWSLKAPGCCEDRAEVRRNRVNNKYISVLMASYGAKLANPSSDGALAPTSSIAASTGIQSTFIQAPPLPRIVMHKLAHVSFLALGFL